MYTKDWKVTWERIWGCNEVVRSKNWWRLVSLIAQIKPNLQNFRPVEVHSAGWEKFNLDLQIRVTVYEGILKKHWSRRKAKFCPQAAFQWLEQCVVCHISETRCPEEHHSLKWVGTAATLRAETLVLGTQVFYTIGKAGWVRYCWLLLKTTKVRIGERIAHRISYESAVSDGFRKCCINRYGEWNAL